MPFWKANKDTVGGVATFPDKETVIFKQGRSTGLTAGSLGGHLPAGIRINGLPGHLHHHAFVVYPLLAREHFSLPGDSGAWALNGDGDLVGQLVGGDTEDGQVLLFLLISS